MLVEYFVKRYAEKAGSKSAISQKEALGWANRNAMAGNIRELQITLFKDR